MASKWTVKAQSIEWMESFRGYYNAMYNTAMLQNQDLPSIVDRYNRTIAGQHVIYLEEYHG